MTKHVHAELMSEYAKDALNSASPWEKWEVRSKGNDWKPCNGHPKWVELLEYRRKSDEVYRIGTIFNEGWMLAQTRPGFLHLIHLPSGNRWNEFPLPLTGPVHVSGKDIEEALGEEIHSFNRVILHRG